MDLKKLHLYLYTFCRYFIATIIISYAFAKLLETQFTTQPSVYDKPISSLSGFQLTWYYYGYSYWYGTIIAVTQIASSLLLFFRKTTRIGVILFLTYMVNIVMVDFAYDIEGAKGMATLLLAMGIFIFVSDYKVFFKLLIQEPPLFDTVERPNWFTKFSKVKYLYIPVVFVGFFVLLTTLNNKYLKKDEFTGTWENVENKERLYFEAAKSFQIVKMCEQNSYQQGVYEVENKDLILKSDKKQGAEVYLKADFTVKDDVLTLINNDKVTVYKRIR
ncbi:hypothetical protein HX052_12945 [Myroides marinus]|uniref:hypothetical protein n=1 Tax=Myroides marinus TaxID=703342 RepID=UPI002574CA95|nr:hypothetical protein [Myroides marinus]MDM1373808.1 hypothetical protein [Myroides marinus]MDM1390864.1 hypothetical protein [Myroides marinus]